MNLKKNYPFLLLVLLHIFLLTQLMFTVWPEMILYPYLMLNKFALYKDIINPYFPGLAIIALGFFKLFGLSVLNLKILTWIFIVFSDGAVILAAGSFYQKRSDQLICLFTFILLQIFFGGNGLWFELALTPFILSSLALVYFYPQNSKKIIISGLLFGMAVLIKQNALLFLVPITIFLISKRSLHSLAVFTGVSFSVLILSFGLINYYGVWNDFRAWAVILPLSFTKQHGFILLPAIHQYPLILFPLIPFAFFLLNKKHQINRKLFWALSLLIALLFAFPRYENFHLQVLAALSCLFIPIMPRKIFWTFNLIVVLLFSSFFIKNFHQPDRFIDQNMLGLSQRIKDYPSVYILNGSDLSYFFAGQLPPKPWAINFPWYFEVNNFEPRFISSLEIQKTNYIVIGDQIGGGKYDLGNYLPAGLVHYIQYNYQSNERYNSYSIWQRKLTSP